MKQLRQLAKSVRTWWGDAPLLEGIVMLVLLILLGLAGAFLWDAKNYQWHF